MLSGSSSLLGSPKEVIMKERTEKCACEDDACDCGSECSCDCCGEGHFQRRFQTRAEQVAVLESYLAELKLEVQAVEEHLAELRK